MKLRSLLLFLSVVVLALLLLSAGGFYWLVARTPMRLLGSEATATPGAALFVPKQAPAMVSLLLNPEQLETAQLVATPLAKRRQVREELAQLKQSLLATTGMEYERDIQPWLGQEITLAVTTLDLDYDAANGQQPGYLAAIATQDPQKSREFLELFWQKRAIAGSDLVFEQYKGVKIIAANAPAVEVDRESTTRRPKPPNYRLQVQPPKSPVSPAPTPALASAAVGDRFILFANHPKVLREAINNVQAPDLSLEQSKLFTRAIDSLTQPRIGLTFVNLPKFTQWLREFPATKPVQPLKTVNTETNVDDETALLKQSLIAGFTLNAQGLLAETALLSPDGAATALPSLSQPVGALQYVPVNASFAASGKDLDRQWTQLVKGLAPYETAAQLIQQPLQDLQTRWQFDLSADVFSWVKGEYALAMLPPDGVGANGVLHPDWVFATQRPQTEAGQQAIAQLDALATQHGLTVGPLALSDRTVSAWTRLTASAKRASQPLNLQADVQGVHATVGKYELFTTSVAAMDSALKAVDRSLVSREAFKQATTSLLQPNNGYLYLDWNASQPLLEQQFPVLKVIELAGKPVFDRLRSLTISSYGSQSGVQRGGAFVQLETD
ncbi:MAG: DUF3352 domain-containing protein [Lyngbya sp. HA4199-MV5]|jgi:hypothetical protein|nr:DUF3352 domain-containing protein [Lyngbya sp. HA4199-MV5]